MDFVFRISNNVNMKLTNEHNVVSNFERYTYNQNNKMYFTIMKNLKTSRVDNLDRNPGTISEHYLPPALMTINVE